MVARADNQSDEREIKMKTHELVSVVISGARSMAAVAGQ
jgi:hypothetical protein